MTCPEDLQRGRCSGDSQAPPDRQIFPMSRLISGHGGNSFFWSFCISDLIFSHLLFSPVFISEGENFVRQVESFSLRLCSVLSRSSHQNVASGWLLPW